MVVYIKKLNSKFLFRTGIGIDIHKFSTFNYDKNNNTKLLHLGGLVWNNQQPLEGHSDGDVIIHSAINAIFSGANLGDLGEHFGKDKKKYKNISSIILFKKAVLLIEKSGYIINNISIQCVTNTPNIASRRKESEKILSSITKSDISLSACTSDKVGSLGRGDGIMSIANALLIRKNKI